MPVETESNSHRLCQELQNKMISKAKTIAVEVNVVKVGRIFCAVRICVNIGLVSR